jgi:hypothetical protein
MKRILIVIFSIILLVTPTMRAETENYSVYLPLATKGSIMGDWKIIVPTATTNLITNPSIEIDTTGWTAGGTNTVAQSSTQSKYGNYSLLCTYQDNDALSSYSLTLTAAAYTLSAWVYIPTNYDGTQIRLSALNFAGATGTTFDNADMTKRDQWQRLDLVFTPDAGDLTGQIQIRESGTNSTVGRFVYMDAAQAEQQSEVTTYCDGNQSGCEWLGAKDASESQRSALSRAGGFIKDLKTDYYFGVINVIGPGMPAVTDSVDRYATLPGGQLNSVKTEPRVFTLVGVFKDESGTVECDINEMRQALVEELAHDKYPKTDLGWQPVILRYTRADVTKEIEVFYEAGLDANINFVEGYQFERASIRFIAPDPFWYAIGENSTALDTGDSATMRIVSGRLRSTGQWDALGPPAAPGAAVYNTPYAIHWANATSVFFGGDFTAFDNDVNQDYITEWDGSAWGPLTTGTNNIVLGITDGPDGTIYVAGQFTLAGGVANTARIAAWDGTAWSALATGFANGRARALVWGPDGYLYAGGSFTVAGGSAGDRIARWDGTSWANVAGGFADGEVFSLVFGPDGILYAGGTFTTGGGSAADYLAKWDSVAAAWTAVGGTETGNVFTIDFDRAGNLYIGGNFVNWDGIADADYIALWNGTAWEAMGGNPPDAAVQKIAIAPDDTLYASGLFSNIGGLTNVEKLARWNGTSWSRADVNVPGTPVIYGLDFSDADPVILQNYDVYIGYNSTGTTTYAGSATIDYAGTTSARPVITINRSGGTSALLSTIRNETTGKELLFDYNLDDGETLTIDLDPASGNIESSFSGIREDAILANSDRGTFTLQVGTNQITVFIETAGSPTITAFLTHKTTYKSFD